MSFQISTRMKCGHVCLAYNCAGFTWNNNGCKVHSNIDLLENSEATDQSCFIQGKYYSKNYMLYLQRKNLKFLPLKTFTSYDKNNYCI